MSKDYSFKPLERLNRRTRYDGAYVRRGQIHLSSKCIEFMYNKVNLYHDAASNAFKIENDKSGKFEINKTSSGRYINAPRLPMPNGRYLRETGVDTNGAIFVKEQSDE